jgi:hypothetical protein
VWRQGIAFDSAFSWYSFSKRLSYGIRGPKASAGTGV